MQHRITRCRYLRLNGEQCTAECADETADVLLCPHHIAKVMELVKERLAAAA